MKIFHKKLFIVLYVLGVLDFFAMCLVYWVYLGYGPFLYSDTPLYHQMLAVAYAVSVSLVSD